MAIEAEVRSTEFTSQVSVHLLWLAQGGKPVPVTLPACGLASNSSWLDGIFLVRVYVGAISTDHLIRENVRRARELPNVR